MYHDSRWTALEADVLRRCTKLQLELGMSRERLVASVSLLRTGEVETWPQEDVTRLFDDLRNLAGKLDKGGLSLSVHILFPPKNCLLMSCFRRPDGE
jgi:hypothetical protein